MSRSITEWDFTTGLKRYKILVAVAPIVIFFALQIIFFCYFGNYVIPQYWILSTYES